ncbi:hypothetical protein C8R44DRAFT_608028 [Mycena epipterygia]|nr:hypothetical protein C8R44DRAFT_608028 [Mycena epipterygia]
MSAHTNSSLRTQSVPLRVLIMGRANAGKTTILKKICYSSENPQIFTPDGKEINLSVVEGSVGRGLHDIENQLIFKSNPQFIFHDSRGFESGSVEETEKVRAFIAKRAASTNLSDQLHAIWYCLPTDTNRPLMESDKQFFNTHVAGKVPVIAIFTKFDALLFEASCQLEDEGIDREEARHRSTKHADKILTTNFINPLMSTAFPPSDYVRLADMHMADSNCNELLEKTANALSDDRRSSLSVPVREIKIDLSTQNAMRNKTPELFPDKPTQPVTILDQFPRCDLLDVQIIIWCLL